MDTHEFDQWDSQRKQRRAERDARRSERRRERRQDDAVRGRGEGRKEKVLHTRISDHLDDALRNAAGELRVPVSNLVRNVLEDVFDVVETVTENVEDLVEDLVEEASHVRERFGERRRVHSERRSRAEPPAAPVTPDADREHKGDRPDFPNVVGWQPLVLNAEQRCADCGRDLLRGDQAHMGVGAAGPEGAWLCGECLAVRS